MLVQRYHSTSGDYIDEACGGSSSPDTPPRVNTLIQTLLKASRSDSLFAPVSTRLETKG